MKDTYHPRVNVWRGTSLNDIDNKREAHYMAWQMRTNDGQVADYSTQD